MKKLLALSMAVLMAVCSLTGCAPQNKNSGGNQPAGNPSDTGGSSSDQGAQVSALAEVYGSMSREWNYIDPSDITFTEPTETYTIAFSLTTETTGFYKTLADAARAEVEAHGGKVIMVSCDDDAATQIDQLESFIVQGADAIIVDPAYPFEAFSTILTKCQDAGIPVLAFDRSYDDEYPHLVSYKTDSYTSGYLLGEYLGKMIQEQKGSFEGVEFAIIGGSEGDENAVLRNNGERDGFKSVDTQDQAKEVAYLFSGGYSAEDGMQTAENILTAHPNVSVIFGTCDAHCVGAYSAAQRMGMADQVIMAGVDGSKDAETIIQAGGSIKAVALNDPTMLAQAAVRAAFAYLVDGTVPDSSNYYLTPTIVTADNVADYIDQAF